MTGLNQTGLPPAPVEVTRRLVKIASQELVPAATDGEFARFSEALFRYGELAGNCFAACQGGPYASATIARRVEILRELGVVGVAQSSWGPTLAALAPSDAAAASLMEKLRAHPETSALQLIKTAPAARGATIEVIWEQA